jgi:hypothetical protein
MDPRFQPGEWHPFYYSCVSLFTLPTPALLEWWNSRSHKKLPWKIHQQSITQIWNISMCSHFCGSWHGKGPLGSCGIVTRQLDLLVANQLQTTSIQM